MADPTLAKTLGDLERHHNKIVDVIAGVIASTRYGSDNAYQIAETIDQELSIAGFVILRTKS